MRERRPDAGISPFDAACNEVRESLARLARSEVLARHDVGLVVSRMVGERSTYGARAVERMAFEVGVAADILYDAALVAAGWERGVLEVLVARTNGRAAPLSWSHFVVLTKVHGATQRRALTERCFVESWSVRDLRRQVAKLPGRATKGDDVRADPVKVALIAGAKVARRTTADVDALRDALHARLVDGKADEELRTRVLAAFHDLHAGVQGVLDLLEGGDRASGTRVKVAPRLRVSVEDDAEADEDGPVGTRRLLRAR